MKVTLTRSGLSAGTESINETDFRVAKVAVRFVTPPSTHQLEEKGLFFAKVRFVQPDDAAIGFRKANWMQVADYSLTASHARHNLLNYTDASVPSLLRAKVEEGRTHENARYDENQVVGYERDALDLSSVTYSAATTAAKVAVTHATQVAGETESFEVLGNSNYHLLTSWNGRARVIDIRADEGREVEAKPSRKYFKSTLDAIEPADVLQTYPISGGFAVELYDSLNLITGEGSFSLIDGRMARVVPLRALSATKRLSPPSKKMQHRWWASTPQAISCSSHVVQIARVVGTVPSGHLLATLST